MKKIVTTGLFFIVLFFNSLIFAQQNDKTVVAFTKSIEQEKKQEYVPAIETMLSLNDSTSYEVNLRLGWLNYKAGNKKKSMEFYNKAIQTKPNAIEPRYGYGFPAYSLGDFNDLIEQDKKILQIDPNNKIINGNLGSIYYYNKEYTKALSYLEKVNALYPFDYDNNLMLGWTNLRMGNNAEAEKYFNIVHLYIPNDASANEGFTAIKRVAPNDEKLMAGLTKAYEFASKTDYKSAVNSVKNVYDKSSYFLNLKLGWYCYLAGLQAEAVNYYKIASELKPNSVEPKLGCAIPTEILGNKNDLKNHFDNIIAIDPHNTYAHYKLGVLAYEKKEYEKAFTYFEKVMSLYPTDADALLMQAWTNYQLNKTSESKALFNKVLCFSPNNASAINGLSLKPIDQIKKSAPLKSY